MIHEFQEVWVLYAVQSGLYYGGDGAWYDDYAAATLYSCLESAVRARSRQCAGYTILAVPGKLGFNLQGAR